MTGVVSASTRRSEPYPLDNQHRAAPAHHSALADLLDPFTRWRLSRLGDLSGHRCLEIGAGGGSVANWLADQVGAAGQVVATDLKTDHLTEHPRMTVVSHDLTSALPWPGQLDGPFDLIHARLTLGHLPSRREILPKLVARLSSGGVLLVEDWAALRNTDVVVCAPDEAGRRLYERYQRIAGAVFDTAGTDPTWAPQVHSAMLEEGLIDVDTELHGGYWPGGSPGARLMAAVLPQIRPALLQDGLSPAELDRVVELLADPKLLIRGHPLFSTRGIRPGST